MSKIKVGMTYDEVDNLFALSRLEKASSNDSDRLKKYLAKFNLTWEMI